MTTVKLGWHICEKDVLSRDGRKLKAGATYKVEGPISLCKNGLHASPTLKEALNYVNTVGNAGEPAAWVSFVEVWGNIECNNYCPQKFCGRFRRHVAVGQITHAEQELIKDGNDDVSARAEAEVMKRVLASAAFTPREPVEDQIKRFAEGRTGLSIYQDRRIATLLRKRNGQKKARKAA